MSRLLKELRYFWQQVRDGYPRQRDDLQFRDRMRSLLALEFEAATPYDCISAAEKIVIYANRLKVRIYADHMYTRCNRGRLKIADFVAGFSNDGDL